MKKVLNLLIILCLSTSVVTANEQKYTANIKPHSCSEKIKKQNSFDEKLGLTANQKQQAKMLRQASYEKMVPLMKEIHKKSEEIRQLKNSSSDAKLKEQKVINLEKELIVLERQVHEIKHQNMKDFENILTDEQKKILKQMKNEGKRKYQKRHKSKFLQIH